VNLAGLRIGLVGPLPPPEGGMANQTLQLAELLRREGAHVDLVRVNAAYPRWAENLRGVRGIVRLVPYVARLWRTASEVDLFHVMANSGWSWHLCAAPAVWIAKLRGIPCVVNYRGGEAESFLERSAAVVLGTLRRADALAVPSGFLEQVFKRWGVSSRVVPNIIDVERFRPADARPRDGVAHIIVARSLEALYDIPTALRAFALVRASVPDAKLTVAGSGPERDALVALAASLGIGDAVDFCGRRDREGMAELYRSASLVINPSRVDNMPNSILEAMASGVPVVSTNAGGVPFIVRDGVSAILVPIGDHMAMSAAVRRVLGDRNFAQTLRDTALLEVQKYTWSRIKDEWARVYADALSLSSEAKAA
jgi:glycosyltransferase involved in cell wall biosynthesis